MNGKDGKDGVDGKKTELTERKANKAKRGKDGVGIKDVLITLETDTDSKTYLVFTIILSEGDPIVRKVLQSTESTDKPEVAAENPFRSHARRRKFELRSRAYG